jgi:hypothetical protein
VARRILPKGLWRSNRSPTSPRSTSVGIAGIIPGGCSKHEGRAAEMGAYSARVDAQKGQAQQHKDGRGKYRLEPGRERGQRDADDDRHGDHPSALASQPDQGRGRKVEKG